LEKEKAAKEKLATEGEGKKKIENDKLTAKASAGTDGGNH